MSPYGKGADGIGVPTSSAWSHAQYIHMSLAVDTYDKYHHLPSQLHTGEAPHTFPLSFVDNQ